MSDAALKRSQPWRRPEALRRAPPPAPASPAEHPLSADGARALSALAEGAPVALVLGGAGTGKTTFLHHLKRSAAKGQVFLAPTGIAALTLGGQTIHSFFGIPPRILNADEVRPRARQRRLLRKLERLVIDEISMVRVDLLDTVDRLLRLARERDEPFGGVQTVLVGDFLQLPPVVPNHEQEVLARLGYEAPFAFEARALAGGVAEIPFRTVHRQADPTFADLLGRIRRGHDLAEVLDVLNEACVRPHRTGHVPVVLTPTNARADAYNARGLAALTGAPQAFEGELAGEFNAGQDRLPAPDLLVLKPGARVLALRNDPSRLWVNGSLGTVLDLAEGRALVRFDSGVEAEVGRTTWEKIRYVWDDATGRVAADVIGTFTQLPLVPAWAMTIHKAQGLTLDDVRIDFDYGAFAPGQVYVALSRVRSLDGLSLARPIRTSDVRLDPRIAAFVRRFEG